jgi:hypothetical protein
MNQCLEFARRIWDLLLHIHPTIAAAGLALIGVILTLRQNRAAIRRQHLLAARREVYLESCNITAESIAYLMTIAQAKADVGVEIMTKLGGVNGKLHLLATKRTLDLASNYLAAFLDEYTRVALPKTKYETNLIEIDLAKAQLQLLQRVPQSQWNPAFLEASTAWNRRIVQLSEENTTFINEMQNAAAGCVERLDPFATDVTLAMREDIEVAIDAEWFRQLRARSLHDNSRRTQQLSSDISATLESSRGQRPQMP